MRSLAAFAFAFVAACSSSTSPSAGGADAGNDSPKPSDGSSCNLTAAATINGTFLAKTFNAQGPVSGQAPTSGTGYNAGVFVPDYANLCALSAANQRKGGSSVLGFLHQVPTPPSAGTVSMTSPGAWQVGYLQYDAQCKSLSGAAANGGSFTITELDACGIALTFDLTFDSGDHVTGSISAPTCGESNDGGTSTCL
jgi:hypothetical protein